jgi:hypothetical protein
MSSEEQINQLLLKIDAGEDADAQDRDEMLRGLRQEVLQLDIEQAEPVLAEPPPGETKGGGEMVGVMVMSMAAALPPLLTLLQGWLARQNRPSARIIIRNPDGSEFEISGDGLTADDIAKFMSKIRTVNIEHGTYIEGDVNVKDGDFTGHDLHKD